MRVAVQEPRDEDTFVFYRNDLGVLVKSFEEIRRGILALKDPGSDRLINEIASAFVFNK